MPEAANMGVLTWDEEIAQIAQRWALQCHFGHDGCRDLPNMKVGQNVAIAGSSVSGPPNMTSLAVMWYEKEVGMFNAGGVASYQFSMQTGHFTQWIWATSYKIGCGYAGFKSGMMNNNFLVCNYGPAGNVMRWPIYKQGSPCSACPRGTTCGGDSRYPNLCKAEGDEVPGGGGHSAFGEGQYEKLNSGSVPGRSALLAGLCGALVFCASAQLLP
ncbi:Venom allergen 5 [Amphibalanus amphitrite]|uniref:Venom allergen 5 n=1 Tax=Amphibalanus amphitrite TaxID=1232801 RepID=A0A6A4V1E8_AMPAM|nr:Venom allergen 5 [Amphibalanus amphitrite]